MNRKVVGGLAGIVVVLLGTLLVTPALIDWTRYKDVLAVRMEAALGRKISLDGTVSFSFFPAPTFSAEAVHLADGDGMAGTVSIAVPRLEVRPRLLPLLTGRLEIASLVLVSPEIRLRRLTQEAAGRGAGAASVAPSSPAAAAAVATAAVSQIKPSPIDSVTVENGTLIYQPADREIWRFDKLGASFSLQASGGGRLIGAARFAGLDIGFEALQGSAAAGQPTPVNLSLTSTQGAGLLRLSGQLSGNGDDRRLKGKLTVKAGDLSRLVSALGEHAANLSLPLGNVSLEAAVNGSTHEIDLDGLSVTLGGVEGTGNASVVFGSVPQIDVKLGFGRLDIDSLLAGLRGVVVPPPAGDAGAPATNPPASGPTTVGFFLPADISATIDLKAAVTVFRGGLLKGMHINAALANGEVVLNQASLSLPGNSEANLFGFVVSPQGVPSFEGSFEAASDDLRGICDWLKIDTSAVPADRLHAARLAGKLKMRPGEIDLDGTQIRLDGTLIDLAATLHLGDKPAIGASFSVDTVNADAYWPRPKDGGVTPTASGSAPITAAAAEAALLAPVSWLAHVDANVKGRIGQVVARGVNAQEVRVDASWVQGNLVLRDLSVGDLAGAQMRFDGGIDGVGEGPIAFRGLHYVLGSKQPDRLIKQAGLPLPIDGERLGAVAFSGTLEGGLDALAVESRNEVAGGVVSFSGKVEPFLASPRFEGLLEANHANLAQWLKIAVPDYRPLGNLGGLAATSHVVGDLQALQLTDFRLRAGPATVGGAARLQWMGKPKLDATLTAGEIPLDAFWPANRPSVRSTQAAPVREEPHVGLPAIATDRVSAAPRTTVMAGSIPERWSREPRDFSWLKSIDIALALDAKAVSFGKMRIDGVSLGFALADGTANLQRLSAQLYGGKLTGSGRLASDGGAALQVAVARAQMRDALMGVADVDVAEGAMDAEVALSTSGLSSAEWIGRLAGAGKFALTDGVVRGFDLKAVDERLQSLDSPTGLLSLMQAGLAGGKTHFASLGGTIRVANGLITTDDIRLQADGGGANVSAQINLPASVMDGRAEFHLASAPAGPPLVMRLSGPLENPRRFVDINEIQQWLVSRGKVKPKELLKSLLNGLGR
ncbi:MAG TPA: AsmA family protein [Telmatospirillum sp.]|nr:AsmA family protein [Telmatospirillum sp.]